MFWQTEEKGFPISWEVQDDRAVHVKDSRPTHYPFTALRPVNNRTYPLILKPSDRESAIFNLYSSVQGETDDPEPELGEEDRTNSGVLYGADRTDGDTESKELEDREVGREG